MEAFSKADTQVLLWFNGWVGRFDWLDSAVRYLASDYLVPVLLSLIVLGMWLAPRELEQRARHQRAAVVALAGMGFAALAVYSLNAAVFRERPFQEHVIKLLFYEPTDSSFPLHIAAVGFGFATGIWTANRQLGALAAGLAGVWGLSRVIAGVSYPSDVLAGAAIGIVVTLAFALVMRPLDPLFLRVLQAARWFHLA
ncbi:MAG: phosphatase PAP2 family protein [Dehalococcoidia bacterium]|nr:phosphatase PAP2 family protein [Dehalococcoidia bacterium]